jgi:hypothetical protein
MQAKRAAIEFLSFSDISKDTEQKGSEFESHIRVYATVEPEIPVYSDLRVGMKGKEEIGSSGFEPLTPTVSR